MQQNGTIWKDTEGQPIQAHGGMILQYRDTYYWYGENKDTPTLFDPTVETRVDLVGISCYSSADLIHWKNEGLVLPAVDMPGHDLSRDMVCERPKVLYNEKNQEFVMWMHIDRGDYTYARAGLALSKSPTGPFSYQGSQLVNGCDTRDMTVFTDWDGRSYLVHSSDRNRTLRISELTQDLHGFTGRCVKILTDQRREAPAVFYRDGLYYLISSGCTGWYPNPALYAVCENLLGEWRLIDNPCRGKGADVTYEGQSTYVFQKDGVFYLMLDHWKPSDLKNSGYSFLPIAFAGDAPSVSWKDTPFS